MDGRFWKILGLTFDQTAAELGSIGCTSTGLALYVTSPDIYI